MPDIAKHALLASLSAPMLDKLKDTLKDELGDAMYCTRCWSAWSAGTMTEADFVPANEENDAIDDIVTAMIHTLMDINKVSS